MKILYIVAASIALLLPVVAQAQDTTVIHKETTVSPPPAASVTIEKHDDSVGAVVDEGCKTKSVTKENDMGDKVTKTKTNCP
jgi:hypothetical protein